MGLRGIVLLLACIVAVSGFRFAGPAGGPLRAPTPSLIRAQDAYSALRHYFAGKPMYADAYPAAGPSSAWSSSQALAAVLSLQEVPRNRLQFRATVRSSVSALDPYWTAQGYMPYPAAPFGVGGAIYYDDNEWLGQDLVRAYDDVGDAAYLARAERIFDLVAAAWDTSTSDACPGGVWWTRDPANHDRNTVSTANAALLGLALYRETGRSSYLTWAQTMVAWVDRCLRAPDGLYADHLTRDGAVEQREWSYNQGAMLAAYAGIYDATRDTAALARARDIAQRSLAHFGPAFTNEPSFFVTIFFRDLQALNAIAPDPSYAAAARTYADDLWASARDSATGLFGTTLLDQAAAVDLYARLA